MDHLSRPDEDLAHPPLEVPFISNEQFSYDDQGFLTYPHRAGVDPDELAERKLSDVDLLAPFIQAWLWFGLLGELLYIGSRPDRAQKITSYTTFVRNSNGKHILCTAELFKYIAEVGKRNRSTRQDDFYPERFSACINKAKEAVDQILSSGTYRSDLGRARHFRDLPVFYTIILSVQTLIETLEASRHILLPASFDLLNTSPSTAFRSQAIDMRLRDAGWCAHDIALLPKSMRLRYYLSLVRPAGQHYFGDHSSCDQHLCRSWTPDEALMAPRHVSPDCKCPEITADSSRVTDILSAGNIPLLTYDRGPFGSARQLQILEATNQHGGRLPFIAISHVRRAGLGNGSRNALPSCQLSRVQELAHDACSVPNSGASPFWIDVMCVPLQREHHAIGIKRIGRVYENAAKVIVLDPSLYNHGVASCEEALIRIRYSLWKSRLWTLQEGVLARELCFKFWNKVVSLDDLLQEYECAEGLPLLQPWKYDVLPIRKYLQSVLELMRGDIKTFKELRQRNPEHLFGLSYEDLCVALRLGYLAFPRYRYFVEDNEMENMRRVLNALEDVYLRPRGMPLQASWRSEDQVIMDLGKLQRIGVEH